MIPHHLTDSARSPHFSFIPAVKLHDPNMEESQECFVWDINTKKQKTLKDVKRVDSRHVFHDLVGKEGIVETLSEQSVTLVHLDLCNETETHGQVERVLIHDSPKEAAFKGNV